MENLMTCPKCNCIWDDGCILDRWKQLRQDGIAYIDISDEELESKMKECYSEPYRFSKLIGIEEPYSDCISIWMCPECKTRWDRFTNEEIENEN